MKRPRISPTVPACTAEGRRLDSAGMVLRVRRLADLSQRDLAGMLGVSAATVARWESGARRIEVVALEAILDIAGLRLGVVDNRRQEIPPVSADAVRDNAGRRFPAHLDVQPPDVLPYEAISSPRYDREPAKGWYHLRLARDRQRADGRLPIEHPTATELEQRRRRRLLAGRPTAQRSPSSGSECDCPTECWVGRACVATCPCQCEPGAASSTRTSAHGS